MDFAQQTLTPVNTDDGTKAQAWEAYHHATSIDDFTSKVSGLDIPQDVKATLWEGANQRLNGATAAPSIPRPTVNMQPAFSGRPTGGTNFQAVPAESTPEGQAAAVAERENQSPKFAAAGHTAIGFGKGAEESAHTVGRIVNAVTSNANISLLSQQPDDSIRQLPTSFQQPDYLRSDSGYETAGKVGEGVLEFVMGDDALKGLKLAEKIGIASKLAKLVSDEPYVAKIVEAGLNASRMGLVSGAQTGLHEPNPGSIGIGTAVGAGGSVLSDVAGAGAAALFPKTKQAAVEAAVDTLAKKTKYSRNIANNISTLAGWASDSVTGETENPSGARTFGDAAREIKAHFNPDYDELREAFGGVKNPATGRYSANGFDDTINQIKNAKKVIYSPTPASTDALTQAEQELAKGEEKLQAMFHNDPEKYARAQAGWAKASTLEDLHNSIEKAFPTPEAVRTGIEMSSRDSAEIPNWNLMGADPKRYVAQVNKSITKIGSDRLKFALSSNGYDALVDTRTLIANAVADENYGRTTEQLTRQYLNKVGSSSAVSKTLGGPAVGGTAGYAVHLLGASNPVTAGIGLTAAAAHFLYTHPDIAVPILKAARAITPLAAQTVKSEITHIYNPDTQHVEPVTDSNPPEETDESKPEAKAFGQLPAETLVPPMASFEGGKSNDLNVRLNNPINLLFKNQPDATPYKVGNKVFAKFETPEAGKQAAIRQLQLDQSRPEYANMSLEDYINSKHSPDSDNYVGQAKAYANYVMARLTPAQ